MASGLVELGMLKAPSQQQKIGGDAEGDVSAQDVRHLADSKVEFITKHMATLSMASSRHVRITRRAISPRLEMRRRRSEIGACYILNTPNFVSGIGA